MPENNNLLLNQIDEAKAFAVESGMLSEGEEGNYLKLVQAQILRLFWNQSRRLLTSDLGTELQHLILQDTVQMAKVLKDWSLGDQSLDIKNKKDVKEYTAAQYISLIIEEAEKKGVTIELPLDKLNELENLNKKSDEENKKKMEILGISTSQED